MSRIAPLDPPYAADVQQHFDRIMRGKPPLVLFRMMAAHPRAWEKFRGGSLLDRGPLPLRVDALHARATLSDTEYAALSAHYDDDQVLEIILLCGFYRTVSYLANALALPLEATAARFPK
jgi:hypothetical protein